MRAWLTGLLVVCWAIPAARADAPPRDLDELRARVAGILAREGVPGAGIALVEGERTIWAGGVGVADLATRRPVDADTLFRVGSITKSFVALAAMRLVERGALRLDARVGELAPELAIGNRWAEEAPITVAHLLEHTAGFDDMHPNETEGPLSVEGMSLRDVLARNPASRVARWRPGSRFSYANPGYTVAAYVLEKVTGLAWDEVLRREALAPLGMTGAALRLGPEVERRLARGYHVGKELVPYWSFYHRPAGSLMASPRELAAIVKLGLRRGRVGDTTLVSPEGMARIERSETARVDAGGTSYGLGNYGEVVGSASTRGHAGGLPGFLSDYAYVPQHDVGFVLLLNSTASGRALREIRHELLEFLLRGVPRPPPPRAPVPEAELARWAGSYHFAAPRHQLFAFLERLGPAIVVAFDAGKLWLELPSGRRLELVPVGGDRFRVTFAAGSHLVFGRDAEGRRVFVDHNHYFVEEPAWRSWLYHRVPPVCVWILASAILLPLGAVGARGRRSPRGFGWPLAASLSFFAAVHGFIEAFSGEAGTFNWHTLSVFVFTLSFAVASVGTAWQTLVWVRRRAAPPLALAYRLAFAAAACATTAYLAAYGLIGLRLWSY